MTSRPSTQRCTLSSKYNDPTGNVTLLSEDNVKFRIQSYYLKAYSVGLREMLESSQLRPARGSYYPSTQYATEEAIPLDIHSDDLEIILDIIHTGTTPHPVQTLQWIRLAEFAHKFECDALLHRITRDIKEGNNISSHPWKVFCLAAKLCDNDLAVHAIKNMQSDKVIHSNPSSSPCNYTHTHYTSPLSRITRAYWMECHADYSWAFMKSVAAYEDTCVKAKYDWNAVADNFFNFLPKWKTGEATQISL